MTITADLCHYKHDCDPFRHQTDALPDRPEQTIIVDYRYRCDECGQRFHVTGIRYAGGTGESRATPRGKTSRAWRRAQHPNGGTDAA